MKGEREWMRICQKSKRLVEEGKNLIFFYLELETLYILFT